MLCLLFPSDNVVGIQPSVGSFPYNLIKHNLNPPICLHAPQANYHLACQHVVDPVMEAARSLHPPKVWEEFSSRLYTTFWSLSLYDLYVPGSRYEDEASKARNSIHSLKDSQDVVSFI